MFTYLRSCRRSLALSIVMSEVVAAGMMTMGVREPVERKRNLNKSSLKQIASDRQ